MTIKPTNQAPAPYGTPIAQPPEQKPKILDVQQASIARVANGWILDTNISNPQYSLVDDRRYVFETTEALAKFIADRF